MNLHIDKAIYEKTKQGVFLLPFNPVWEKPQTLKNLPLLMAPKYASKISSQPTSIHLYGYWHALKIFIRNLKSYQYISDWKQMGRTCDLSLP